MIDKERALKLLGANLGPSDVARALGCDPSYISQLLMDDAFRSNVLALRMEGLQAQTQRDKNIDGIEDTLIEKLKESVPFMVKSREILQAFAVLNAAKRRGASAGGEINFNTQVVTLVLPEVARKAFIPQVNAQGEVVQVGEQITTTMPLQQLLQERLKIRKAEAIDAQEIPNGSSPEGESGRSSNSAKEATAA